MGLNSEKSTPYSLIIGGAMELDWKAVPLDKIRRVGGWTENSTIVTDRYIQPIQPDIEKYYNKMDQFKYDPYFAL